MISRAKNSGWWARALLAFTAAAAAPILMADFPPDQWQKQQANEMFDGLQGRYQPGTQSRMARVAWLYSDRMAVPNPLTVEEAKKLVAGCVHTGESQMTRESFDLSITCAGKNKGILFRFSDGQVVTGEIINPPPLLLAPN